MKQITLVMLLGAFIVCMQNCTQKPNDSEIVSVEITKDSLIKKGDYLVGVLGCNDCHSPKKLGPNGPEIIPELLLSGYPSDRPIAKVNKEALAEGWTLFNGDLTSGVGPWGMSFAANLTSDESGIGNWTLEQFKTSLTKGLHKGLENSRPLLPPMPWFNYVNMHDSDLEAIYTYLQSTNPVKNVVPAPIPPDQLN
ncbi:MAG TPA: diheme cytochrome c-553 [Saprospiraceae bacterium]|nr:diheme cytochrome c-553 [Saprospiraceae bacterium]